MENERLTRSHGSDGILNFHKMNVFRISFEKNVLITNTFDTQ